MTVGDISKLPAVPLVHDDGRAEGEPVAAAAAIVAAPPPPPPPSTVFRPPLPDWLITMVDKAALAAPAFPMMNPCTLRAYFCVGLFCCALLMLLVVALPWGIPATMDRFVMILYGIAFGVSVVLFLGLHVLTVEKENVERSAKSSAYFYYAMMLVIGLSVVSLIISVVRTFV